jgi:hypothetical protein
MGTCKTCGGTGLIPDPDQDEEDDITCPTVKAKAGLTTTKKNIITIQ